MTLIKDAAQILRDAVHLGGAGGGGANWTMHPTGMCFSFHSDRTFLPLGHEHQKLEAHATGNVLQLCKTGLFRVQFQRVSLLGNTLKSDDARHQIIITDRIIQSKFNFALRLIQCKILQASTNMESARSCAFCCKQHIEMPYEGSSHEG